MQSSLNTSRQRTPGVRLVAQQAPLARGGSLAVKPHRAMEKDTEKKAEPHIPSDLRVYLVILAALAGCIVLTWLVVLLYNHGVK